MTRHPMRLAVFPGTFDPVTNGHLDIIRRGAALFDQLVVAVGNNPEKTALCSLSQRTAILRQVVADIPNVRVEPFEGLTADFARKLEATAILRGLRNGSDLQFESQVALTNRAMADVETLFMLTAAEHAFISSSLIRQIAKLGGDVSALVPPDVLEHLKRPDSTDAAN